MTTRQLRDIKKAMIEAAQAGGKVLMRHFGKALHVRVKKGAGLVTQADVTSEKVILKTLKKVNSDFSVLAEESGSHPGKTSGRWIIDPLDGTTNYVHGFPMFCVSIAAEWEGQIIAGVIHHPVLNETYVATKGGGSFLNGKPIQVSKTSKLSESLLTTGFTYRKDEWLKMEMEAFERLSGIARAVRRPGSAALDLAYTARGVFDGFWERRLSPWDVAAGAILISEAGGKVTDFKGNPFKIQSPEILAASAKLHPTLLQVISRETCPI